MSLTLNLSQDILNEKQNKIIPNNIKKGITIFGVNGNCEGVMTQEEFDNAINIANDILQNSSPGPLPSGDIKQFHNLEEMKEDPNMQKHDLASIYRKDVFSLEEDITFNFCTFPNTVILDEAITNEIQGYLIPIEEDIYIEDYYSLTPTSFIFEAYTYNGHISVSYTSSDGITYTRTDYGDENEPYDFGHFVKPYVYSGSTFNPIIGNFIKVVRYYYDGLFECLPEEQEDYISITTFDELPELPEFSLSSETLKVENKFTHVYEIDKIKTLVEQIYNSYFNSYGADKVCSLFIDTDGVLNAAWLYRLYNNEWDGLTLGNIIDNNTNKITTNLSQSSMGFSVSTTIKAFRIFKLNLENMAYEETLNPLSYSFSTYRTSGDTTYFLTTTGANANSLVYNFYFSDYNYKSLNAMPIQSYTSSTTRIRTININIQPSTHLWKLAYQPAKNQLNAEDDDVYGKYYFGKDGVGEGTLNNTTNINTEQLITRVKIWNEFNNLTLNVTNLDNVFDAAYNNSFQTDIIEIPNIDTSAVTNMSYTFRMCYNLKRVPNFDTSNVVNIEGIFSSCHNIEAIPNFNLNKAKTVYGAFYNCRCITSIPNFDLRNVTSMGSFVNGCTNLVDIPYMPIPNAKSVHGMVQRCPNLSDASLNNVMGMVAGAPVTGQTKQINLIGFEDGAQMNRCKNLSNYQALRNAGWQA